MRILLLVFMFLTVINFVAMVECKNWKKDEKYWLFSMVMSIIGFWIVIFRIT